MNGIWCNFPEVWTHFNKQYEISDMGNVRDKESETVLHRFKVGKGYAGVAMYGTGRKVHPWVLKKFIPCPSPMFNMCDHINRDRMDPRLINLRWSNVVLNAMNKTGVRGWEYDTRVAEPAYQARLKILGMPYLFTKVQTPALARAEYEYYQSRAYQVIDALCSRNIHWKFQRMIIEYWLPFEHKKNYQMKWEVDEEYARRPLCGRLV
jgi:hypothetical protein